MSASAGRRGLRSTAATECESPNLPSTSADALAVVVVTQTTVEVPPSDLDVDNDDYGDMHRLVLQGIMAAGFLDSTGVKLLFNESFKQLDQKPPEHKQIYPFIQKVVREINDKIKFYDMSIRSSTCEITGDKYYVFLITIEKAIMKLQTFFSRIELELFQKIIEFILLKTRSFKISMMDCVNLNDDLENRQTSKVDVEDFVRNLISQQYLTEVPHTSSGRFDITLGFRAVREFEPIFREDYPDIFANCCLCKMILLNGLRCPKCTVVIHRACLKKYMKSCKSCVSCKGVWSNQETFLVRTKDVNALPSTSSTFLSVMLTPSVSRPGRTSQIKKIKGKENDEENEDVDMPILLPMQPVDTRRARAPITRGLISPSKFINYSERKSRYINSSSDSD